MDMSVQQCLLDILTCLYDSATQVPAMFDKEELREKLKKLQGGPTTPLNVHLRQELDRLNIVIKLTASTLKNLRLAIAGTIALSGGLIDSLDALFNARIPQDWLKKSWEASTLGNWFLGLLQRYDQLNKWLNAGRPKAYWMTGFFNPQVSCCCTGCVLSIPCSCIQRLVMLAGILDSHEAGSQPQACSRQVGSGRCGDDI